MKRKIINILLAILLSISIICVICSFTLLNKNFVKHYFNKYDYYTVLYEETDQSISKVEYKEKINKYIKSRYSNKLSDNSFSKYLNKYKIKKISYIIYGITLIIIMITGNIFTDTKKKHDLYQILFISSIILILCYGIFYICIKPSNMIVNKLFNISNHYLLGFSIILLEISIYKLFVKKIVKKCK